MSNALQPAHNLPTRPPWALSLWPQRAAYLNASEQDRPVFADQGLDAVDLAQVVLSKLAEQAVAQLLSQGLDWSLLLRSIVSSPIEPTRSRDLGTLDERSFLRSRSTRWSASDGAVTRTRVGDDDGDGSGNDRLFRAIVGQESGGANSTNRDSGALGIGQVMPANVRSWSKEVLGEAISPKTFKARPDLQRKIVAAKLGQYYREGLKQTGSEDEAVRYAAAKWYSGRGELRNSRRAQYTKGTRYPSIYEYSNKVLRRYKAA